MLVGSASGGLHLNFEGFLPEVFGLLKAIQEKTYTQHARIWTSRKPPPSTGGKKVGSITAVQRSSAMFNNSLGDVGI